MPSVSLASLLSSNGHLPVRIQTPRGGLVLERKNHLRPKTFVVVALALIFAALIVYGSVKRPMPTQASPAPPALAPVAYIHDPASIPTFITPTNPAILDTADALDRAREFGREAELVEARRLFQLASRQHNAAGSPREDNFIVLMDYLTAVQYELRGSAVESAKQTHHRAQVCGAEIRGHGFEGSAPGDCQKLTEAWEKTVAARVKANK